MKKVISIILCFVMLLSVSQVYALQDDRHVGNDDALLTWITYETGNSPLAQSASDSYLVGSTNWQPTPCAEGGTNYTLPGNYTFGSHVTENTELTIRMYAVDQPSMNDVDQRMIETFGETYGRLINSTSDHNNTNTESIEKLNSKDYVDLKYTIHAREDGTKYIVLHVPEGFELDGRYRAALAIIDGKEIELEDGNIFYMEDGGSQSNEPTPTVTPPPPPSTGGQCGIVVTEIPSAPYKNDPSVIGEITNPTYDVKTAIPTSENLTYKIKSVDAAKYDIYAPQYSVYAYANDATLTINYIHHWIEHRLVKEGYWDSYSVPATDKKGKIKKDNKGNVIYEDVDFYVPPVYEDVEHFDPESVSDTFNLTSETKYYWSVDRSNISPVQRGTITAIHESAPSYRLSADVTINGMSGPGPSHLNVNDLSPATYSYSENWGQYETNEIASLDPSALIANASKPLNGWFSPQDFTYDFAGCHVTPYDGPEEPNVPKIEGNPITKIIPSTHINGTYIGTCTAIYADGTKVNGSCNDVIVHTPVVNNSRVEPKDSELVKEQLINYSDNKKYIMLDEQFAVIIPDNIPDNSAPDKKNPFDFYVGYKNPYNSYRGALPTRPVTTWGKQYDIKFPFDVYFVEKSGAKTFIKAGDWLSDALASNANKDTILKTGDTFYRIPGSSENGAYYTFILPVWVKEDNYSGTNGIQTRVIAENYPVTYDAKTADSYCQETANTTITNYIATKSVQVEVVGKIYDLRVSSSDDPGWLNKIINPGYITAKNFPFGQAGQNTVTGYKFAPKLGYSFVFDFKTKGRKSNTIDVGVYPEFYFVGKDGNRLQKVDLYFRTSPVDYKKIENSLTNTLNVKYSNTYMKVPQKEMIDARRIYDLEFGKTYNYTNAVAIGSFAKMNIPHDLRLCFESYADYGEYDGISKIYGRPKETILREAQTDAVNRFARSNGNDHVIGSVGHWFVGYQLPSSTVAVPVGANIKTATAQNQTLRNGYILIKMNIKTKDPNKIDYLQYRGPEVLNEIQKSNWNKEFTPADLTNTNLLKPITLPNGTPNVKVPIGTIAIYETDQRANNDFEVIGTH